MAPSSQQHSPLRHTLTKWLLIVFIVVQVCLLIGMYAKARYPLVVGTPINVAVLPVDPRSLLRGNYAILRYPFSQLDISSELAQNKRLFKGAVVYVPLKPIKESALVPHTSSEKIPQYEGDTLVLDKPTRGVFIRGRVDYINNHTHSTVAQKLIKPFVRISYGVEAYFTTKKCALVLEEHMSVATANTVPPALVTLKVTSTGKAAIESIQLAQSHQKNDALCY